MGGKIVSFCIATFQRYEILMELVNEILSVDSHKIEVVVCDDHSLDGSVEKLRCIDDARFKLYTNEKNVGSMLNIYESLNKGSGKYLFYVNDSDNVDKLKINLLVNLLEQLDREEVAFARCTAAESESEKYRLCESGKDALVGFACRMDHPTGFIFRKCNWDGIQNKRRLFENQKNGDYVLTQICAIMALNCKGALLYGDFCELKRKRIDFSVIKSGYYKSRADKRLWYSPEIIFRELVIGQNFLKQIGVKADVRKQILLERYTEYLSWCVTEYKRIVMDPVCTDHYDVHPPHDFFSVTAAAVINGIKLWRKTKGIYRDDRQLHREINRATRREYMNFLM